MDEVFPGVYRLDDRYATLNLTPGLKVYGEKLQIEGGAEYRFWNPLRSKLSAALKKGLSEIPILPGTRVLYLGAATGTTASHVSDIVGPSGMVYSVEAASIPLAKLIRICETRSNMTPLYADANNPEIYAPFMEPVDVIYQDISQRNQAEILLKNAALYLRDEGHVLLAVKAKSIDAAAKTGPTISREIEKLKDRFHILEVLDLEPFEKDHAMVLAKKKQFNP